MSPVEVVDSIGLSAAGGTLARPSAGCGEDVAVVGDLDMTLALAAPVAQTADSLSAASGEPPISFMDMEAGGVQGNEAAVMDDGVGPRDQHRSFPSAKQRRAWLRDQKRKAGT